MKPWKKADLEKKGNFYARQVENGRGKSSSKYHSKKATAADYFPEIAGRSFPSRLERNHAIVLVLMERAGDIKDLVFQPRVFLTKANISYHADFCYRERIAPRRFRLVYDDTKGFVKDRFRIIVKLWGSYGSKLQPDQKHYGRKKVPLRIFVDAGNGRTKLKETIWPS